MTDLPRLYKDCCDVAAAIFDGDFGWITESIALVTIVLLFNFLSKWLLKRLHIYFESQNKIWSDAFVRALHKPLSYYVWFFAFIHTLNMIYYRVYQSCSLTPTQESLNIGFIVSVSWFLMRWKHNITEYMLLRVKNNQIHLERGKIDVIDKIVTVCIFLVALILVLDATGTNMNTLIAFGGVGGLAIAFASQEIMSSFFGGMMIYVTHPFSIGDWVELKEKEIEGTVEEIGWYMTKIRTFEKRPLYVPNSLFSKLVITTPSRMSHRRIKHHLQLRYEDLPKVRTITEEITEMLEEHPDIDPSQAIIVNLNSLSDYSIQIVWLCYTLALDGKRFHAVQQEILISIAEILTKNQAEIAYPTSVYLESRSKKAALEEANPTQDQQDTKE